MANRVADWLRQSERDLEAARTTFAASQFDWACFAAQQAAEKALKALYGAHHAEGWGHVLRRLIEDLADDEPGLLEYLEKAMILDKYYIPTRYPNGLADGAPADAYTRTEAEQAIAHAEDIARFCQTRCRAAG
ncbi:MAG: HEPN domain-containing protein [Planctomycetes bacterium]|nr:HEPN domain-containing protein [Planctomycetota bacterium]